MKIITITIEEQDGQTGIGYQFSDGVTPAMGETVCRFVAERFREAAIEEEVKRRLKAAQKEEQ